VVSRVVLLDSGPLGLASNPRRSGEGVACAEWLQALVTQGARVILPEIADYEVRRELLRANKVRGLERLDALVNLLEYLPLTTASMRLAAELWAAARKEGRPTADEKALDGDVILAAQALTLGVPDVVIATTNVAHLSRFAPSALWTEIAATAS
jgi:predicted nucleic acid-binding protein